MDAVKADSSARNDTQGVVSEASENASTDAERNDLGEAEEEREEKSDIRTCDRWSRL